MDETIAAERRALWRAVYAASVGACHVGDEMWTHGEKHARERIAHLAAGAADDALTRYDAWLESEG